MYPLRRRLENLECHFTWNLTGNTGRLHRQQEFLEERSQHPCAWEGHLYNLLGYMYHISKSTEEALTCLRRAEVVIKEQEEGRGPRLLVNQANLAWVHYHLGELPESQAYLEEVARLLEDFPAPPGCDLHPEVHGEKGWTQVKFDYDSKKQAVANFEKALRGDPKRKEWHAGLALAKYKVYFDTGDKESREAIIRQITHAKTMDPDNLRMSTLYLTALAVDGRSTAETVREAQDLAQQVKPDLEGLGDILHLLRWYDSLDAAIQVAEDAEKKYGSQRGVKKHLAICYKWKIFDSQGSTDCTELMKKGIKIYEEVTRLYPYYLRGKIDLAAIYAKSGNAEEADKIYKDLLNNTKDLEPQALQLLYSRYGSHIYWFKNSSLESVKYYKMAAEIPEESKERQNSIRILRSIVTRGRNQRCDEIRDFLFKLEQK